VQVAFVDVPGHERFVRNMLAGAGGIDAVMLVVAATESVKPQTREHFDICRLLGVQRGIVVLSKSDLADAARIDAATAAVRSLVRDSFLAEAPIIPVSALTGAGIDALRAAIAHLAGHAPRLARGGAVRLPVDRVFTVKGFGAVVTGTLVSGTVTTGDALAVLPEGSTARVRGLQVHGAAVGTASAPTRAAVNVAGVDAARLHRGVTLATPGTLAVTSRADVRVSLLAGGRTLPHGARVRVHQGTAECFARVSIAAIRADEEAAWRPARPGDAGLVVPAGGAAFVRLRFGRPLVLTRGDRLVLRTASPAATIGGAVVLDPECATGGVRREGALARFRDLDDADPFVAMAVFLGDAGEQGLDAESIVRRGGGDPAGAPQMLATIGAGGAARRIGDRVFAGSAVVALRTRILGALTVFHQRHADEPGVPRETLRARTALRARPELFEAVIGDLIAERLVAGAERLALASHRIAVSSAESGLMTAILARLRQAGLAPPDAATLATELRAPGEAVAHALQALVRDGRVVRTSDIVFHREALDALRASVAAMRADQPPAARVVLDVAAFKAQHGLTRKHAIPLLEWLDRERVTRRVGETRVVL
jgi:selenocysteine-specific elongation factor